MASASGNIVRRTIQRRPLVSFSAAVVTGTVGYASFTEYQAQQREQIFYSQQLANGGETSPSIVPPTLPRSYDWDAVDAYWSIRPVTTVARLAEIGTELLPLLAKYIFDFYVMEATSEGTLREHAQQWRQALTNLGPAWVKAGQQLSIRPDLCAPVVLDELQKLCDAVQPVPDEEAMRVLTEELGMAPEEAFDDLRLVASASLGQVYKGKLKGQNTEVAVKVQRPGMLKAFSMDLFLLQQWGVFMEAWTSIVTNQQPYHKEFLRNFAHGSYGELDYELEAKNQIQFQHELEIRSCPVDVPKVYLDRTTRRVLTTQWIDGIRLSDSSPETIRRLIPVGVELFLCQLLDIGAFHADPHPGNLLVTPEGKLCLLDFGLCAEVDPKAREGMTQAIFHLLKRDFDSLVSDDAKQLGFLPHDYDTTELKPLLKKILTGGVLEAGSNFEVRKRKFMEISNELNEVFFQYPFSVPPFFALVTRGLGLLEGIALTGDPNFDIFRASAPYATKRAMQMAVARSWTTRQNNSSNSNTAMATSAATTTSRSSR